MKLPFEDLMVSKDSLEWKKSSEYTSSYVSTDYLYRVALKYTAQGNLWRWYITEECEEVLDDYISCYEKFNSWKAARDDAIKKLSEHFGGEKIISKKMTQHQPNNYYLYSEKYPHFNLSSFSLIRKNASWGFLSPHCFSNEEKVFFQKTFKTRQNALDSIYEFVGHNLHLLYQHHDYSDKELYDSIFPLVWWKPFINPELALDDILNS